MQVKRIGYIALPAALIVLLALIGCNGGGSNSPITLPTNAANTNPFDLGRSAQTGRVLYRFQLVMTDEQQAALAPAERAAITSQGATINGNTITFPDVPAVGHWVRVGTARANTDSEGRFGFPSLPAGTPNAAVFIQLSDTEPRLTVPVAGHIGPSGSVSDIVIVQSTPLPGNMNPGTDTRAAAIKGALASASSGAACCGNPAVSGGISKSRGIICSDRDTSYCGGNDGPCCLDYNSPTGTGAAYKRTTFCVTAYTNFLHSTCYEWSGTFRFAADGKFGTACANEIAYRIVAGPGCYANHKYRNCQFLDNSDFSIKAPATRVFAGEKLTVTVRNNTQANETDVQMTANPGTLTGDTYTGTTLNHYKDDTRDIPAINEFGQATTQRVGDHYVVRDLIYTAPPVSAFPPGVNEFPVTVTARAFGKTDSVTFTVCKCGTTP